MRISSRTPEGSPGACPVCGAGVVIEPSLPHGDAPCPACGSLLWFIRLPDELLLFDRDRLDPKAVERIAALLADENRDSLGVVELLMELEEFLDDDTPTG